MNLIQAILLGLIQGLTEFIPVSSSGHLAILDEFFGWEQQSLAFDIFLHGATLLVLVIYFRKKLFNIGSSILVSTKEAKAQNIKLVINIMLTSIPMIIVAVLFKDQIETSLSTNIVIAIALFIGGVIFILSPRLFPPARQTVDINHITPRSALIIGLFQVLALIRGASRSGSTITGGLVLKLNQVDAAEFSFLSAIVIVGGSLVYQLADFAQGAELKEPLSYLFISALAAFISGYWAIGFLLKYLKNSSLVIFGYYRVILALLIIIITIF